MLDFGADQIDARRNQIDMNGLFVIILLVGQVSTEVWVKNSGTDQFRLNRRSD
jgi:hypothetical protein